MLKLRTFGGLALASDERAMTGAAQQRRPLALLAILAVAGDRGVSRERLQALIWPESDETRARRVLAQTLYALRRDLGDPASIVGTTDLRLNHKLISADVSDFECAVAAGQLERAIALYQGPFLDGVHLIEASEFEQWATLERARLEVSVRSALERLAREAAERGDAEVSAGWWRRLAVLDPLSGRVALGLMQSLASYGDIAAALQHARVHTALLREELGAPPDPAVTALCERLRTPEKAVRPVHEHASQTRSSPAAESPSSVRTDGPKPQTGPAAHVRVPILESLPETRRGAPHGAAAAPALGMESITQSDDSRVPRNDSSGGHHRAPGWRRTILTVAVAGVILGAIGASALLLPSGRGERELERRVVVVAPFDVADPELRLWREGMVDVLSRDLDGAGPLRTVSPTRVVREWGGRADRETVGTFARRLGAGTAVYGGLVRAGVDSLRASLTVLDVETGRAMLEVTREESVAHMGRLTDSIAVDVLRAVGRVVPLGAARASTMTSATSLGALRAFLRGEEFYRRTQWDSAVTHYEQAVALDTTLALAWRRLGAVASWRRLQQDSLVAAYLLRAGAANRGYGRRDSLLLVADSLSAAANTTPSTIVAFGLTRRLFATLDTAVRRYPEDPEVWFALGEARYHFGFGPMIGVSERATLAAFDTAIALDSAFAPAYIHSVELGFNVGGAPLGLRYARSYLALRPTEDAHRGVLLVEPLVNRRRAHTDDVRHLLDTARTSAIVSARTILRRWPDSAETAVRLGRILATGRPSEYRLFADTAFMRRRLAEQLAFRGRLGEAYRVLGNRSVSLFAELAYLGAIPPAAANIMLLRWVRDGSGPARLALAYWSAQRDTNALNEFLAGVRARSVATDNPSRPDNADSRARTHYDTSSVLAHLTLARGDTARALSRLLALPDTLCAECFVDRLTKARLLTATGRAADAVTVLEEALVPFLTPIEVVFALERARAARVSGENGKVNESCQFVGAAWAHGDTTVRAMTRDVCTVRR